MSASSTYAAFAFSSKSSFSDKRAVILAKFGRERRDGPFRGPGAVLGQKYLHFHHMFVGRRAGPLAVLAAWRAPMARVAPAIGVRTTSTPAVQAWDDAERRKWIEQFRVHPLESREVQISFARSSGPGGQNVNKCT